MKLHRRLFLGLFCGNILFLACSHSVEENKVLYLADSLIESKSDSALYILRKLQVQSLSSTEQARYALLLTQALDKNGVEQTSDSVINIAANYYSDSSDEHNKCKSFFYQGRIYQNNNDYTRAINSYLIALRSVRRDSILMTSIYDNLGTCYKNQDFYAKAMEVYQQSYLINKRQKNRNIIYPLRGMASIHAIQDKPTEALNYYQQALSIALESNDSTWKSALFCDMARIYDGQKDYKRAYKYISQSILYVPSRRDLLTMFFWKGEILYHLNEIDSAFHFLTLAKKSIDLNTQASVYQTIYELKKTNGEYDEAILYNDTSLVLYDSIQSLNHSAEISNILKNHEIEIYKQKERMREQKQIGISAILILVSCMSVTFYFMYIGNYY